MSYTEVWYIINQMREEITSLQKRVAKLESKNQPYVSQKRSDDDYDGELADSFWDITKENNPNL